MYENSLMKLRWGTKLDTNIGSKSDMLRQSCIDIFSQVMLFWDRANLKGILLQFSIEYLGIIVECMKV